MQRHSFLLFLGTALLFTTGGCSLTSSQDAGVQGQPLSYDVLASTDVEISNLSEGQHSTFNEPNNIVVRTQSHFEELWTEQLFAHRSSPPRMPEVNFEEEMVVVAIIGSRRTGGYNVTIAEAERTEDGARVGVIEEEPGPQCHVLQAMTSPFVVAKMTAVDGEITFEATVDTRSCG